MQDSDDNLFEAFDDIDESVIAAVDEEESKYVESQRLAQSRRALSESLSPPPPKRQKLSYDRNVQPIRTASLNNLDDLPEISVCDGGIYDLETAGRPALRSYASGGLTGAPRLDLTKPRHVPKYNVPAINVQPLITAGSPLGQSLPPQRPQKEPIRGIETVIAAHAPAPQQEQPSEVDSALQEELEKLRAEFLKLKEEQEQVQRSLKAAEDARLAKEGEVSILRKGIEKTAQEHASEVARIKAAKDTAEAMQLQLRTEMKEEMDRLKTQFTFRQHELETSSRSTPWTARSKKIGKQAPPTPVQMPAQMRQWNVRDDKPGPSALSQSPNRARPDLFSTQGHEETGAARAHSITAKAKKTASFPGFVNAFTESPSRSQANDKAKDKEKELTVLERKASMTTWFSRPLPPRRASPVRHSSPPSSPPSSPTRMKRPMPNLPRTDEESRDNAVMNVGEESPTGADMDIEMVDQVEGEVESPANEAEDIPVTDWRAEVHRIVLNHKFPQSTMLTVHLLLSTPLDSSASMEQRQAYSDMNKQLLENLGINMIGLDDPDPLNRALISTLVAMAGILCAATVLVPLVALLHLLRVLALSLPSFPHLVMSPLEKQNDVGEDVHPPIFVTLCDIIRVHLAAYTKTGEDELDNLAKETIALVEVLAWNIPVELVPRLSFFARSSELLSTLLAPVHPTWFLNRAVRLLALFASHHDLFKHLLSIPRESEAPGEKNGSTNVSKIPQIEQLASYLMDPNRQDAEAHALKEAILIFVASLTFAHPDALTILVQSQTLIPSISVFLTQLTTPFFEEDEALMRSPALVESTVIMTVRTLSLLYSLVFGGSSPFSLRHKILHAPYRQFHGIQHMLIVTLGRLSYADPPHDLSTELRNDLDQIIDMAKALLELLVDGPEHELVWAAFQVDQDINIDVKVEDDDEEQEARMRHPIEAGQE